MKVILTYPIPFNVWPHYWEQIKRFTKTFKEFPPGEDYQLHVTCHWGEPVDQIRKLFYGIKTKFVPYYADGCQIGAQQDLALMQDEALIVGLTTHAYFFREGWLKVLLDARRHFGPGLFAVAGSREGGVTHLRTSCYLMDADIWKKYPWEIKSREDNNRFEHGCWCCSQWVDRMLNLPALVVNWDDVFPPGVVLPNGYRNGNQEQMLVWDRHSDLYRDADEEKKREIEAIEGNVST